MHFVAITGRVVSGLHHTMTSIAAFTVVGVNARVAAGAKVGVCACGVFVIFSKERRVVEWLFDNDIARGRHAFTQMQVTVFTRRRRLQPKTF